MQRLFWGTLVVIVAAVGCGRPSPKPSDAVAPAPADQSVEVIEPSPTETPQPNPDIVALEAEVQAEIDRDASRGFTTRIGSMVGEEDGVSDAFSPTSSRFRVTWTVNEVPTEPISIHLLTDTGRLGFQDRGEVARIEGATKGAFVWKNAPRTHKLEVRGAKQWYMLQVDE